MGGHETLVQKTDDVYQPGGASERSGVGPSFYEPGRFDGKAEPALYPEQADPEREQRRETDARIASLLHAAAYTARTGLQKLNAASEADRPDIARTACASAGEHLMRALPESRFKTNALIPFGDAYACVTLLLDAASSLSSPPLEVGALWELLGKIVPPDGFVPPKTLEQARKVSAGHVDTEADRANVVVHQLHHAARVMDGGMESYRAETDPTGESKAVALGIPARIAAETARYAEGFLSDAVLALDTTSPEHTTAIVDFLEAAQRLVYRAMDLVPVREMCDTLAEAAAPLAARIGAPGLTVAAPGDLETASARENRADALTTAWVAVFEAQAEANRKLALRPEPEDPPSWNQTLVAGLCQLALGAVCGWVGAAVGAAVSGGSKTIETAFRSAGKKAGEAMGKGLQAVVPATAEHARRAFFEAQVSAATDMKKQELTKLMFGEIAEAKAAPNGGAILKALTEELAEKAKEVEERQMRLSVQAWASYLASQKHGRDEASNATDLTGVGPGIESPEVSGSVVQTAKSRAFVRPTGVLELNVALDGVPHVEAASIKGLRPDDAADLTGLRVGQLVLPIQIYIHDTYYRRPALSAAGALGVEETAPAFAVISRNEAGVFWLRDATRAGRILLASIGDGDDRRDEDVLRGAADLWQMISDEKVPAVQS